MAPEIINLIAKPAVIHGKKRALTGEPLAAFGIVGDMGV
jgi:hypothetical protein